jgi:ABC-type Fe3+ transport system permease subunit
LAKPSFEPFLLAFGATFAFRAALPLFCDRKNWPPLKNSLLLAVGLGLMALIVLPLGRYSKEAYGKAFFAYPRFWM